MEPAGVCLFLDYLAIFIWDLSLKEGIMLLFGNVFVFLLTPYLFYRNFDWGLRPLKFYKEGIEVPEVVVSWKVPEMRRNNTFPTRFVPFSQIDKIKTIFDKNRDIFRQYILLKKDWEEYKFITRIYMHPPLAKEVIGTLKTIVGIEQLKAWLSKADVRRLQFVLDDTKQK